MVIYQIKVLPLGKLHLWSKLKLEGRYMKSSEVQGVARQVVQLNPLSSMFLCYPNCRTGITNAQKTKWKREIVQYARPGNWLPPNRLQSSKRYQHGVYASFGNIYHSPDVLFGFNLLRVVKIPLNGLLAPTRSVSIMSDDAKVYATRTSMYVTTS